MQQTTPVERRSSPRRVEREEWPPVLIAGLAVALGVPAVVLFALGMGARSLARTRERLSSAMGAERLPDPPPAPAPPVQAPVLVEPGPPPGRDAETAAAPAPQAPPRPEPVAPPARDLEGPSARGAPEPLRREPANGSTAAPLRSHLLLVPTGEGYVLAERSGDAPDSGTAVDGADVSMAGRFVVARVGPSPLPHDERRCAYLERAGA